MQYAQIIKGKANIIDCEPDKVDALKSSGVDIVDISQLETAPQKGWTYDSETGGIC